MGSVKKIESKNDTVDDLLHFLKFKSISADNNFHEETINCANWLNDYLQDIGLESKIYFDQSDKKSKPIILAKNTFSEGKKTLLIYGHYDVQPPDPLDQWKSDPFEPVIKDDVIYARGATDNKGQIFGHISGIKNWINTHGDLPVNLIFLIEGEEEIGSPYLERFINSHKDLLENDIILISDTGMIANDIPTITYSLRGIVYLEVLVTSSSTDLHSGIYGGVAPNPALELSKLLSNLKNDKNKINIPRFYESVKEIESWERSNWDNLSFDEEKIKKIIGVKNLSSENGYSNFECMGARPAFDINGITSGYQGEGSKTIIPNQASAKISFRLVPDQNPELISEQIIKYFETNYDSELFDINFKVGHSGKPYFIDPNSGYGQLTTNALKKLFQNTSPALIREGGSIPIVQSFKDVLNSDSLLVGFAPPDGNIHAPNENFPISNFKNCIKFNNLFLEEFTNK